MPAIVLEFSASRSGAILHEFFPSDWRGDVQSDGAKMYPGVFKHRPNIRRFECVGHLRRYVLEAIKADEMQALPLLRDIDELYAIERHAGWRQLFLSDATSISFGSFPLLSGPPSVSLA